MTCLTKEPRHETTLGLGALGTGSVSSFAPPISNPSQYNIESDGESPSMIKTLNLSRTKPKKVRNSKLPNPPSSNPEIEEDDDDDDDFKKDISKKKRQVGFLLV